MILFKPVLLILLSLGLANCSQKGDWESSGNNEGKPENTPRITFEGMESDEETRDRTVEACPKNQNTNKVDLLKQVHNFNINKYPEIFNSIELIAFKNININLVIKRATTKKEIFNEVFKKIESIDFINKETKIYIKDLFEKTQKDTSFKNNKPEFVFYTKAFSGTEDTTVISNKKEQVVNNCLNIEILKYKDNKVYIHKDLFFQMSLAERSFIEINEIFKFESQSEPDLSHDFKKINLYSIFSESVL